MKIKYNAPVILTYTFLSGTVLMLSLSILPSLTETWFFVSGKEQFNLNEARSWITIITHIMGHVNWNHFISNFAFILLIGPILEEYYGSVSLFLMILITAIITGLLNVWLFSSGLLGASGVVFMMILLASFTNISQGEIPLTFLLILALYLGRELFDSFSENNISQFTHIIGGFCGSLFGFFRLGRLRRFD